MRTLKLLLIDFYDSFTYNIVHYLKKIDSEVEVVFYDKIDLNSIDQFDGIVLSPGPGLPEEKKDLFNIISEIKSKRIPILGICLGFQAIAQYSGLRLKNKKRVKHGVSIQLTKICNNTMLLKGIMNGNFVGLYNSWGVLPDHSKKITSYSIDGDPMSFECIESRMFGVQFHPESVLTFNGIQVFKNFIEFIEKTKN